MRVPARRERSQRDTFATRITFGVARIGPLSPAIKLVEAHASFDSRHNLRPLAAFRPSPQTYWNAYHSGTPVSLTQLGVSAPPGWNISVAFAHRCPDRQPTHRVA